MASLDKLSADLKHAESKKDFVNKKILSLLVGWKDHEEHLDFIRDSFGECLNELRSRERDLNSIQDSISSSHEELESLRQSIAEGLKNVESKENEFRKLYQKKSEKLDVKHRRLISILKSIELKEEKVDVQKKLMDDLFRKFDLEKEKSEKIGKSIEESYKEMKMKEKVIELKEKELKDRDLNILLVEKEIETKEMKAILSQKKELQENEKQLEMRSRKLHSVKISYERRRKELQCQERKLQERVKAIKLREKQFSDNLLYSPPYQSSYSDIRLDGKGLQLHLNERDDHDSMAEVVTSVLMLSTDPSKLVLDAMDGFYPPHLKKGDKEFEGDVVRRSCILLLEQLGRMSPRIHPRVKEAAMKLAGDWKGKMVIAEENTLEIMGFLQLLASYGLAPGFEQNEILALFVVVRQHIQTPHLFQHLGFTNKFSDFMQLLLQKDDLRLAIRYIYALELVEKFPPLPLLKAHLVNSEELAKKICMDGNNSCEAQVSAINKELTAVKAVIQCIADHGLEVEYPPKDLEARIDQLEILKETMISLGQRDKINHPVLAPNPNPARAVSPALPCAPTPAFPHAPSPAFPRAPSPAPNPTRALAIFPASAPNPTHTHVICPAPTVAPNPTYTRAICPGPSLPYTPAAAVALSPSHTRAISHTLPHAPAFAPAHTPTHAPALAPAISLAPPALPRAPAPSADIPHAPALALDTTPAYKAQQQQENTRASTPLPSEAQTEKTRGKRPAEFPALAPEAQLQSQHVRKHPRTDPPAEATFMAPRGIAYGPPQMWGVQFAERGRPLLRPPSGAYNFGDMNPAMPYRNPSAWQYRPNTAANGTTTHVDFPNSTIGASSYFTPGPPNLSSGGPGGYGLWPNWRPSPGL